MRKIKIGLMLLVPVVLCCSLLTFAYCKANSITFDSLAIKYENYKYNKDQDEVAEENNIPKDCGYDDVGGTPEEQDEYSTQNVNNYNISDVNERVKNYLVNSIRQSIGYNNNITYRVSVQSTNNDSEVVVKIYMNCRITSDNRDFIKAAAIQAIGDDIKLVHDGLYNTYINYGFDISSLYLATTDNFGDPIIEVKGGNMGYTDNSIDLGL